MDQKTGPIYSTGILISNCLVLTAANSFFFEQAGKIYSAEPQQFYLELEVIPA